VTLVRERLREARGSEVDPTWIAKLNDYRNQFEEAMSDDFNTPRGIAALFDLSREVNSLLNSEQEISAATLEAIDKLYVTLGQDVLGIQFEALPLGASQAGGDLLDGLVRMLIELRQEARQSREWAKADEIRDQLANMGITLEDGPEGTRWRLQ
jgi:cysteinyl-tRNA synthetase